MFSRKVLFGYVTLVAASVGIGLIAMGTWAHHMFVVGLGSALNSAFAASTMLVAVPTGIKIFNWLGTMYGGKIRFATPMLFCCAFLFQFLCAGLTGIMLSVAPFDWQLSDSYFVVAHFHFVLIGGLIFTVFGGHLLLVPEGHRPDAERAAGALALLAVRDRLQPDLPDDARPRDARHARRIYTYAADRGWEIWNLVTTLGVPFQIAGVLIFLVNIVVSLRRGSAGRRRPLGRLDARVGHDLAAAALQLRGRARGLEPAAAVGSEASRRPGRSPRMSRTAMTLAAASDRESRLARARGHDRSHRRRDRRSSPCSWSPTSSTSARA